MMMPGDLLTWLADPKAPEQIRRLREAGLAGVDLPGGGRLHLQPHEPPRPPPMERASIPDQYVEDRPDPLENPDLYDGGAVPYFDRTPLPPLPPQRKEE